MIYQEIDRVLSVWAKKNNVTIITQDRDWEIRAFIIDGFYIFIDHPSDAGVVKVKIYQNRNRRLIRELSVSIVNLSTELDQLNVK